ncbi:MAG: VOC family protein [Candidatus Eremiobacteraeota bacterium]|nr:VOC family protein [Candidatus Eremiobacteraeota bacterium]
MNANAFLTRIILYARDVRSLAEFYRDMLGLSVVGEITEDWAVLGAGHCELALHRAGVGYRGSDSDSSSRNSNAKLVFVVHDEMVALRAKLIANGVAMREIKTYVGFTGPLCDGTDPEGNVFQLAQA